MKTMIKSAALGLAIFAAVPAAAQTGGIVTVDLNRLFSESLAAKNGATQIQTKYQGTATSQQNAFNAAATAYNTQVEAARKLVKPDGSGLPDANRAALADAQQKLQAADEALNRTQQEANAVGNFVRDQILRAAVPIAEQIRAERKVAAVIPRNEALAADPAADVTTTLMQRLDTQLKTVSIQLPQQGAPAAGAAPAPAAAAPAAPAAAPGR
ncbi:OmpH family outer membrane protein [Sphingomonas quercus]|uniref:OmpH family outer membrane protein n=1 Tax=Sphingomonas quercus TaxID=2842451 RepID=A0ABS6BEL7_9SPHN|nr:OmpH family outer membrane protein [Sphingomonas quercus]MBU3076271.1 OmpH family outer membrane protein [Sphingomonas quercus]